MTLTDLAPGFADPVRDAAVSFRTILDAMARPGELKLLPVKAPVPAPLNGAAVCIALSLMDPDTPYWLAPDLRNDRIIGHFSFHTGAPFDADIAKAQFAFFPVADLPQVMLDLAIGTDEYPDRSATAIALVPGFDVVGGARLAGPGIETTCDFAPGGMTADAWDALERNAMLFPLGVDTIFAGPDSLAAIPRSTRLTRLEA
ncbi:MAG: phosphonate C-P lyase system protein PhnH [Rhodospirillaceae bacterium]|jgi:alpha-D-ribose 1-methylphosphonate 5-triphosphate synthase subunit PhnH|uniref:phosphonate C-P lyase system protein PhnH n=1 Tax=unclassified Hwanghaeella TaxID=2605944 RepID=UPI000C4BA58F|nr:phosphonate C-P lyase system protein PhnH [Rhodospirillales bacterium]MAX48684.1 phosphonate C-P lyase system protein PhnH [Rhodospirillaceae bacterium]|tara:strand:+ start:141778 stop:142380 length:603 start_codon:yes stop_codon:yes gene_type:complete